MLGVCSTRTHSHRVIIVNGQALGFAEVDFASFLEHKGLQYFPAQAIRLVNSFSSDKNADK